ncbi:MAG: thiamine-phosphate pyrophosphorylase [Chlamydiales bacterium]|jgi:thiamine-phosphate pyrophosphorylase
MDVPRLLLISDGSSHENPRFMSIMEEACAAGIEAIQLREKQLDEREFYLLSRQLREISKKYGVRLYINECVEIAKLIGADGVHLPEKNLSSLPCRDIQVGVSVHSIDAARQAEKEGADYITFGPIFSTASKERYGSPQGLKILKKLTASVEIPVIAVGGIDRMRAVDCIRHGAYGISVISNIMHASQVGEAVQTMKKVMEETCERG